MMSNKFPSALVYLRLKLDDTFTLRILFPFRKILSLGALNLRLNKSGRLSATILRASIYLGAENLETWMEVHRLAALDRKRHDLWLLIAEIEAQSIVKKIRTRDEDWRNIVSHLIDNILDSEGINATKINCQFARHVFEVFLWKISASDRDEIGKEFTKIVKSKLEINGGTITEQVHTKLNGDGIVTLGEKLNISQLEDIWTYLKDKSCRDSHYFHQTSGQLSSVDDIRSRGSHYASYSRVTILNCPHLLDLCNDPAVISLIGSYLGCVPTLSGINLFWTFATPESGNVSVFHRDQNGFRSVSMYVFLTEVDSDSGPHQYVRSSADHETCREVLNEGTNKSVDVDQFFSPPWASDMVEEVFGQRVTTVEGVPGTTFLTDAYGLHRGVLPKKQDRLLFYAVYSLIPIESFIGEDSKVSFAQPLPWFLSSQDGLYTNREFFKSFRNEMR